MCLGITNNNAKTRSLRVDLPQKGFNQKHPHIEDTSDEGLQSKKLLELSTIKAEAAVDAKLFKTLLEKRI